MTLITEISELVKCSVLVALDKGYTYIKYGKCKGIIARDSGGIIVQIEVKDSVREYQLTYDEWFDTNKLSQSLLLITNVTSFIIAHNH